MLLCAPDHGTVGVFPMVVFQLCKQQNRPQTTPNSSWTWTPKSQNRNRSDFKSQRFEIAKRKQKRNQIALESVDRVRNRNCNRSGSNHCNRSDSNRCNLKFKSLAIWASKAPILSPWGKPLRPSSSWLGSQARAHGKQAFSQPRTIHETELGHSLLNLGARPRGFTTTHASKMNSEKGVLRF